MFNYLASSYKRNFENMKCMWNLGLLDEGRPSYGQDISD